ncbi:MAG: hypothetical protein R2851_08440 [Caldilineaceae bacterium]
MDTIIRRIMRDAQRKAAKRDHLRRPKADVLWLKVNIGDTVGIMGRLKIGHFGSFVFASILGTLHVDGLAGHGVGTIGIFPSFLTGYFQDVNHRRVGLGASAQPLA